MTVPSAVLAPVPDLALPVAMFGQGLPHPGVEGGILLDAGGRDGVLPGVAMLQILAVVTVLAMGRRVARHA